MLSSGRKFIMTPSRKKKKSQKEETAATSEDVSHSDLYHNTTVGAALIKTLSELYLFLVVVCG